MKILDTKEEVNKVLEQFTEFSNLTGTSVTDLWLEQFRKSSDKLTTEIINSESFVKYSDNNIKILKQVDQLKSILEILVELLHKDPTNFDEEWDKLIDVEDADLTKIDWDNTPISNTFKEILKKSDNNEHIKETENV